MHMLRAVLLAALILATLISPTLKPSTAQTTLPSSALIVDDGDAGFALFGPPSGWHTATSTPNDYFNGDVTWTSSISGTSANENYARWSLPVSATLPMTYEVRAFVPRYNSSTQAARYIVAHGGLTNTATINQNNFYAEWVSLGSYGFVTGTTGTNYVELGDTTNELSGTKRIGFDAIAFVPQVTLTVTPTLPFTPTSRVALPVITRAGNPTIDATATTSRYIQTLDATRHTRMGCEAGTRGEHGVVILTFGQPWAVDLGYGVLIFGTLFPATMIQVSDAVKAFIRGYAECAPVGTSNAIQLGLGVNNYKGETNANHGKAWAAMVNGVNDWLETSPYKNRVSIFGAADMEPGFNTAANTRAWFDGYMANAKRPLFNFGSCDGCPTALNPTQQPNNGWTVDDIWHISAGASGARSVPEVYLRSGITADQWYRISLYGATQHNKKIEFAGALTQYAACQDKEPVNCALNGTDNTPDMGLRQLNNAINADTRTAFSVTAVSDITWKQDVTTTTPASRLTEPRVAYSVLRSGYVIEDVQPPLPAATFIGHNVWIGNVNGDVVQVYAGLVRDWNSEGKGDVSERGGLVIFTVQADGTIVPVSIARAPDRVGALRIVSADGGVLTLSTDDGRPLHFDLVNQLWLP